MRISDWSSDVCSSDLRDQAVAAPADRAFLAVDRDPADEGALPGGAAFLIIDQHEAILVAGQIGALEKLPDVVGVEFASGLVGELLDVAAERGLEPLGELQPLVLLDQPRDAAFARLRVDADYRFVIAARSAERRVGKECVSTCR